MTDSQIATIVASAVAAALSHTKSPEQPPFRHLVRDWISESKHRPSWAKQIKRLLENELASLAPNPTRADVGNLLRSIKSPSTHNQCLSILSAVYRWALATDRASINPAYGFKRKVVKARDRVLSLEELKAIWKACNDQSDYSRIVRLLLLTGQRLREIGNLSWSEIRDDSIHFPGARVKNHRPHIVPLSSLAVEQLPKPRKAFVFGIRKKSGFSGWSKAKSDLDKLLPRHDNGVSFEIPDWHLHDLRRSFVTHTNELGLAPPHIIEAVVNHVSGHRQGVAGIYNRAQWLPERRELMEKWAAFIERL